MTATVSNLWCISGGAISVYTSSSGRHLTVHTKQLMNPQHRCSGIILSDDSCVHSSTSVTLQCATLLCSLIHDRKHESLQEHTRIEQASARVRTSADDTTEFSLAGTFVRYLVISYFLRSVCVPHSTTTWPQRRVAEKRTFIETRLTGRKPFRQFEIFCFLTYQ